MSKMKLPTGPTAGIKVSGADSRSQYFCGVAAMIGTPPKDALLFMSYPVTRNAPNDAHTKIDTKRLAEELGVPVGVNAARVVTGDEAALRTERTAGRAYCARQEPWRAYDRSKTRGGIK